MTSEQPCVIVISGLPGAGKSTTARALAGRLDRAAHVEADALQHMIVSGVAWPSGLAPVVAGGTEDDQLRLRLAQSCLLARSFVEAGFVAVVDEIVIGDRLGQLVDQLRGVDTRFVMLDPPFADVRDRWVAMGSPFADRWDWIEDERQRTERVGLWLDTAGLPVNAVVDRILARLDEARLVS